MASNAEIAEAPEAPLPAIHVGAAEFVTGGSTIDQVRVRISYGIIERFSEGLYSSPNKAFEELVSNAYDAGASRVWVEFPTDLQSTSATVVVIDDGVSMTLDGLKELWQIGESPKRRLDDDGNEQRNASRAPIGKFGIGKLATFVLATKLTYVCRRDDGYLAVTMDFGQVQGGFTELQPFALDVVQLTQAEAEASLRGALLHVDPSRLDEFFADEPEHWTAAVLTDLREQGRLIQPGRLRWILRTALPLSPAFSLSYLGDTLEPSKAQGKQIWSYEIGKSDNAADSRYLDRIQDNQLRLPSAGLIRGHAELYEESLQRGKSEQLGRSHGFFVKVRGRLINIEDELFGIEVELRHGTFTRFRMEVDADDMDQWVASPRESIQYSPALVELREYLLHVFNKARRALEDHESKPDADSLAAANRIASAPAALSQRPLRRLLAHAIESGDDHLTSLFNLATDEDMEKARDALASNDNLLGSVQVRELSDPQRLVGYDAALRSVVVNANHPFVRNHLGSRPALDVVRDIGAAELLTEAFLLDQDFPTPFVRRFLERRDAVLRALTKIAPRSAMVAAQNLRDSKHNESELEDAVGDALEMLGYEVRRISGNGKADGVAYARLGRLDRSGEPRAYSVTYDAKSVRVGNKEAIQAGTAKTSTLRLHREKEEADHTLLVAPDFEGATDPSRNLGLTCVNDSITPMRVEDLARLLEVFPFRRLSPATLRPLFEIRLPSDAEKWVTSVVEEPVPPPPVGDIFAIIAESSLKQDSVSIDRINTLLDVQGHGDIGVTDVETIVRGMAALAPNTMYVSESAVSLNGSPQATLNELFATLEPLPAELVASYRESLKAGIPDAK